MCLRTMYRRTKIFENLTPPLRTEGWMLSYLKFPEFRSHFRGWLWNGECIGVNLSFSALLPLYLFHRKIFSNMLGLSSIGDAIIGIVVTSFRSWPSQWWMDQIHSRAQWIWFRLSFFMEDQWSLNWAPDCLGWKAFWAAF